MKNTKAKQSILTCVECGQKVKEGLEYFDAEKWCLGCLEDRIGFCQQCENRYYREELTTFGRRVWCEQCLQENTTICVDCSERIYLDYIRYCEEEPVCQRCYDDNYFYCDGCDSVYRNLDYGSDGYCLDCTDGNRPESEPDNSRYYTESRRDLAVGVEIEAEEGNYGSVFEDLADKGFGVCSDGSLSASGIEIQVPASNGGNTEKLVRQACQSLEKNGFEISRKCGLHVHFEYKSRFKTIKHLLLMIYACEPVFYALNPKSRRKNNFCQSLHKAFSLMEILRTKAPEIDMLFYSKKHQNLTRARINRFKKEKFNECRYFGFNLHSLFYQHTVEFRYHAGTMDPYKIMRWINFLKAILLYVRFNYSLEEVLSLIEQPTILSKIKYLKKILKLDKRLVSHLTNRYRKFQRQYVRNNLR